MKKILKVIKRYLICLKSGHRDFFEEYYAALIIKSSIPMACMYSNLKQRLFRRKLFFNYDSEFDLYFVKDGERIHYFSEKVGLFIYQFGLKKAGLAIAESYCLDKIKFNSGDVVIDCGANCANLYLYFQDFCQPIKYHSFEPSPREFQSIQKNVVDGINNNIGLHEKNESLEFFLNSQESDSSFIKPKTGYTDSIIVDTIRLDDYLTNNNLKTIKLLKLEAEGLEPEILNGTINSLSKIEYIAIDGGAERGLNKETTIEYSINFLISNGFKMLDMNLPSQQGRALFKKIS